VAQYAQVGPAKSQSPVPSTSGIKRKAPTNQAAKSKNQHTGFAPSDFVHPDDILHKNGKVYYKNLKCNYCSYKVSTHDLYTFSLSMIIF